MQEQLGAQIGKAREPLNRAISHPGSVKINVEGAFIVDDEPSSRNGTGHADGSGIHYEHKDIRLPHHTGLVSHVAVDVSYPSTLLGKRHCDDDYHIPCLFFEFPRSKPCPITHSIYTRLHSS